jgi:transposase
MRYMLTDELWAVMGPLVGQAKRYKSGQQPQLSERMFFEAVLYIGRTGIPWRDLPSEFGIKHLWQAIDFPKKILLKKVIDRTGDGRLG